VVFIFSCQRNESDTPADGPRPKIVADSQMGCLIQRSSIVGGKALSKSDSISRSVFQILTTLSPHTNSNSSNSKEISKCTATLIDKDILITAAHCVKFDRTENVFVLFNISALCSDGMNRDLIIPAKRVIYHEKFKSIEKPSSDQSNDDIALIQLSKPAPAFSKVISFFDTSDSLQDPYVSQVGYGKTSTQDPDEVSRLRAVDRNLSDLQFEDKGMRISIPQKNQLGACQGDSGGPLLVKTNQDYKIMGIASYIEGRREDKDRLCENSTAYYLNAAFYKKWIQKNIKKLKSAE